MNKYFAVKKVLPVEDYQLLLTFANGEKRLFDMKPYLKKGIFKELKNVSMFNTVHVSFDTVEWNNEADLDPEMLYDYSKKIKVKKYPLHHSSLIAVAEPKAYYRKEKKFREQSAKK